MCSSNTSDWQCISQKEYKAKWWCSTWSFEFMLGEGYEVIESSIKIHGTLLIRD